MIIFLYGSDTFRSRQKLAQLKKKFLKEIDRTGVNLTLLEGEKLSLSQFREAIEAGSFFALKKMVVIENLLSRNKGKKIQEEIMKYLEERKLFPHEIIIFWEEKTAKSSKSNYKEKGLSGQLFNKLLKEKYVQEFEPLEALELNKWVKSEVKGRGGEIDNQALNLLVSYVGNDLWQMTTELDKLIAYSPLISEETVNLLVRAKFEENIFRLMDAVSAKDKKLALKLLESELKSGTNEIYLLSMLTRQFRILLQVKDSLSRLKSFYPTSQQIAEELKIHPYVAKKSLGQARNFTLLELKNIYQSLLAIDIKIKTGQGKVNLLFDLLIVSS